MFGIFGKKEKTEIAKQSTRGTRDLLAATLTKMNINYQVYYESEKKPFCIQYQGGNFVIYAEDDTKFITICYHEFYSVQRYDVDELSRLYRTINELNKSIGVTVIHHQGSEEDEEAVTAIRNILFIPEIPSIEAYLDSQLQLFFRCHHYLITEMERQRAEETQQTTE